MRRERVMLPALALALGLALSGCGDPAVESIASAGGAPAGEASPKPDAEEQGRKFAQCMRENGVDMPDPEPGSGPRLRVDRGNQEQFRKAIEKCRELRPAGGERLRMDPERLEQVRAFATCMRDNGVDVPDPDPNGGGFRIGGPDSNVDRESPTFKKAMETCRDKLPQRPGGNQR